MHPLAVVHGAEHLLSLTFQFYLQNTVQFNTDFAGASTVSFCGANKIPLYSSFTLITYKALKLWLLCLNLERAFFRELPKEGATRLISGLLTCY